MKRVLCLVSSSISLYLSISDIHAAQDMSCPVSVDHYSTTQTQIDELARITGDISNSLWADEKWSDYKTDECVKKIDNQGVDTQLFRCKDGTIVHKQPQSTGLGGWDGYCGETAFANISYMYCSMISSPIKLCAPRTDDITPGVRPDTLKNALNTYFEDTPKCPDGKWVDYYDSSSAEMYISYLNAGVKNAAISTRILDDGKRKKKKKIAPFPVLVNSFPLGSSIRHWVTVVDIEHFEGSKIKLTKQKDCKVVVNHWGSQYKVPCHRMAAAAKASGDGIVGVVTGSYPRVKYVAK